MTDIHSCSYYCGRPECIKAQRDEMRDKLAQRTWVGLTRDAVEELFWPWSKNTEYKIPLFEFRKLYSIFEAKLKEKNT